MIHRARPEIGNNVVVERGLGPDEMIIVEGFHKLSHGVKVAPVIVEPEKPQIDPEDEGRFSFGSDSTDSSAADTTAAARTSGPVSAEPSTDSITGTKTENTTANEK